MLFIRKSRVRLVKQIQIDNSVCFQSIAGSSKYRKLCQYTSRRMYRILPGSSKRWSQLQLKRSLSMLLYPSSWRFCHIEVCTLFLGCASLGGTASTVKLLTSEATPLATQFFKRAYKISHPP